MQYVLRYRIASDKAGALREWLRENSADIETHAPDGWHYAGSYFVVRGFGDYDCEMRYDLDDYAAMDSENPPRFNEIVREWQGFVNDATPTRAVLLKSADEVVIVG